MQWLLQTLLLGLTLLLAFWIRLPAAAMAGFILTAIGLILSKLAPAIAPAALWIGSLAIWVGAALGNFAWDSYYAVLAGLIAAAIWVTPRYAMRRLWNAAIMAWLLCAALLWLGAGYFGNQRGEFYAGLLATLAVLILFRICFRRGAQAVNTAILLLVGLPLVDLALRQQSRVAIQPETCHLYYSYEAAKGDPEAFGRWAEFYATQFDRLGGAVFEPAPNTQLPFRLRPNSHGTMVSCPVSINSLGFRGPEFSAVKNGAYRIVAVGESTTFGMTIQPGDRPWPEMLEQIIRERLKTRRPVQVINAGVPAYSLLTTLYRLPRDILPLQPDMIISYHGANGFSLIDSSLLPPLGPAPPAYEERPIKLAADAEHRLRVLLFARRHQAASAPGRVGRPLDSRYASAYRELIQWTHDHGLRLALANFSMAVNQASDSKVIDFYRGGGTRAAYGLIRANAAHSDIVRQLVAAQPEVCFVDTHPHLDGDHEKFIDLIHLTDDGRRQLAENMFAGIRATLERDLAEHRD